MRDRPRWLTIAIAVVVVIAGLVISYLTHLWVDGRDFESFWWNRVVSAPWILGLVLGYSIFRRR